MLSLLSILKPFNTEQYYRTILKNNKYTEISIVKSVSNQFNAIIFKIEYFTLTKND